MDCLYITYTCTCVYVCTGKFIYQTTSFTLKKVMKTYEFDVANKTKAKKVLNPPLMTADPIVATVILALSRKLKKSVRYSLMFKIRYRCLIGTAGPTPDHTNTAPKLCYAMTSC